MGLATVAPLPQYFDLDGDPLDGGKLYFGAANQNPLTNPVTVYWDAAATIPAAQPVRTINGYTARNGTPALLYATADYSVLVQDRRGQRVVYAPNSVDFSNSSSVLAALNAFIANLASTASTLLGDWLVGAKRTAIGAVGTTVHDEIEALELNAVVNFDCDPTGAVNCTTEMKAFFDACIAAAAAGKSPKGYIPQGTYLITAGVLVFDNGFTDQVWPDIFTAGHQAVTFERADATNAPLISITNGAANSPSGKYWRGGCLGGITFDQNGQVASPGQHAINLRGIWGTSFGWMRANDQGGSCVHIEPLLYLGNNPDPYAVTFCTFEGIEANRCDLWALQNENYVGFNFCTIERLRVIECEAGGWFGLGSGNTLKFASMGTVKGYAFDDGTHNAATGGAPNKCLIELCELDDVQTGFRLNRMSNMRVHTARFVHRYNFSNLNPSEGYWPRKAIVVAGGASPSVVGVDLDVLHRLEAGTTLGNNPLGTVNASTTVTVTHAAHGYVTGNVVALQGVPGAVNGIPAAELNGRRTITVVDANSYTFTSTTPATSTGSGGGAVVQSSNFSRLGAFTDLSSSASILNLSVNHRVVDNAGFGILDTELFTGLNVNCTALITRDGTRIADRTIKPYVRAAATAATTIPNTGYAATKIQFPTEDSDRDGLYNGADTFTVPFTGAYRVKAIIALTAAAGTRIRMAIMKNASAAADINDFAATAAVQHYQLNDVIECIQGDTLWVSVEQNTGTATIAVSTPINAGIDNHFIVEAV